MAWSVSDLGLGNLQALSGSGGVGASPGGAWAEGHPAATGTWQGAAGTAEQCHRRGPVPRQARALGCVESLPRLPLKAAVPRFLKRDRGSCPGHFTESPFAEAKPRALYLSQNRYSPPASARLSRSLLQTCHLLGTDGPTAASHSSELPSAPETEGFRGATCARSTETHFINDGSPRPRREVAAAGARDRGSVSRACGLCLARPR